MAYDFETLTPALDADSPMRRSWTERGFSKNVIDYGVAEMKFPWLPELEEAIVKLAGTNVMGYSGADDEFYAALKKWMKTRHNFDIETEYVNQTFGVVMSIGISIRALTEVGDNVLIMAPVYNPFAQQIRLNKRNVVESELIFKDGKYEIDFEDFEKKIKDAKLFILCSPHNPVGRVWKKWELEKISQICLENGVTVVSDEIHHDIVFDGQHIVYGNISPEAYDNCVICTAPSKTFNIPGLIVSNTIIKNPEIRKKWEAERDLIFGHYTNPAGCAACTAVYTYGEAWTDEMCQYIKENFLTLKKLLAEKVPQAYMADMEGTYLAWVNLDFLGLDDDGLKEFMEKADIPVNIGSAYGAGGSGFIRVNIGCPRIYVEKFVDMLAEAVKNR